MEPRADRTYTAFADSKKIAAGKILDVALKIKKSLKPEAKSQILIFDDATCAQVEIDLRGTPENITRRLESLLEKTMPPSDTKKSGPGRPKLGVIPKEVTLLPEHWDWLASQPGGASVTLRRLVEDSRKKNHAKDQIRQAQEAVYKFMTVMAGDLENYEEALRALYAKDQKKFEKLVGTWPRDVREHTLKISENVF